jgi:hypothetical protein
VGWLCDGAIFLEFHAVSGRYYMPWVNGTPATGADWTVYLDSLFTSGGPLARLDSAAAIVGRETSTPRRVAVSLMVPYPNPHGDTLRFLNRSYAMSADSLRLGAVTAYLREVVRRFGAAHFDHETLSAFYWLNEGITAVDTALVPRVTAAVRGLSVQSLWIPSYGAAGAAQWRSFGFDRAWLQPNYFFHTDVAAARLDSAVARARSAGMGLELEFDRRMFQGWEFADRLEPYLGALEASPDLRAQPIAIYEGAGALIQLARSRDSWHRALYARLVAALQPPTAPPAGR